MNYRNVTYFACLLYILCAACKKYVESEIDISEAFTLVASDTLNVRADGKSVFKLILSKNIEIKDGMKVSFESTKGTILLNNLEFKDGEAVTQIRVDQDTGTYFVKAVVKDGSVTKVEKAINFSFLPAQPDFIGLEPDKLIYNFTGNKQIAISTFLLRNTGLVTKGRTANFSAYQLGSAVTDTNSVGRFTGLFNNFSGTDGKLATNVQFFTDVPGIDTLKSIFIKASSINDQGKIISNTIKLQYIR